MLALLTRRPNHLLAREIFTHEIAIIQQLTGWSLASPADCLPGGNLDRHFPHAGLNRDRGEPHGSSPPTPPDMRVRIRRFGGLSYRPTSQSRNPERVEVSIGQCNGESPGEFASRHGPWALPAVWAARSLPTPRFRSSANRTVPRFHCFQIADRSLRRIHSSRPSSTEGVWQFPK